MSGEIIAIVTVCVALVGLVLTSVHGVRFRCFFTLLVVMSLYSPLGAQDVDKGEFYLKFAGSAVFPYDPVGPLAPGDVGDGLKVGAGFTAAFGYAFKEGFSTKMEWGYQKVGIDQLPETFFPETFFQGIPSRIDVGGIAGPEDFPFPSRSIVDITFKIDGKIKTQSLMGNVYYRYPKWRVSPYAGQTSCSSERIRTSRGWLLRGCVETKAVACFSRVVCWWIGNLASSSSSAIGHPELPLSKRIRKDTARRTRHSCQSFMRLLRWRSRCCLAT